jgi:hypothetical protein
MPRHREPRGQVALTAAAGVLPLATPPGNRSTGGTAAADGAEGR